MSALKRIAPTVALVPAADDGLIDFLREWATRQFEAGEDQMVLHVLPETMIAVLKRLEVVEAAMKMGAAVH